MIYYLVFCLNIVLFFIVSKLYNRKSFIPYLLPIIVLAAMAGLRDFNVGIDIKVYGTSYFYRFSQDTLSNILVGNISTDRGYALFNWIVGRFTDNLHVFYFCLNFVSTLVASLAMNKYGNLYNTSKAKMLFVYQLLIWPLGLNILRQSVAMSFIFFAIVLTIEKKYLKAICIAAIAYSFHSSALVAVIFIMFFMFVELQKSKSIQIIYVFSFIVVIGLSVLYFRQIISILYAIGIISSKFLSYSSNMGGSVEGYAFSLFLYMTPNLIMLPSLIYKNDKDTVQKYLILLAVGFLLSLQNINYVIFGRMGAYLMFYYVIYLIHLLHYLSKTIVGYLLNYFIDIWFFVYFYIQVIIFNYGEISVYTSEILRIWMK